MNDTFDLDALRNELTVDHGRRQRPCGTVVGIGHDIRVHGLSDRIIDAIFAEDIERTATILDARLPWWRDLPCRQQRVMVNLAFNMGMGALQGFRHFLAAMERHDWAAAAAELQGVWWGQVGERGPRTIARLTGAGGV